MNISEKFYLVNLIHDDYFYCYVDTGNLEEENININRGFEVDERGIWMIKDVIIPKKITTEVGEEVFLEAMNNVLIPLSLIINKMVSKSKNRIIGEIASKFYGNNKTN